MFIGLEEELRRIKSKDFRYQKLREDLKIFKGMLKRKKEEKGKEDISRMIAKNIELSEKVDYLEDEKREREETIEQLKVAIETKEKLLTEKRREKVALATAWERDEKIQSELTQIKENEFKIRKQEKELENLKELADRTKKIREEDEKDTNKTRKEYNDCLDKQGEIKGNIIALEKLKERLTRELGIFEKKAKKKGINLDFLKPKTKEVIKVDKDTKELFKELQKSNEKHNEEMVEIIGKAIKESAEETKKIALEMKKVVNAALEKDDGEEIVESVKDKHEEEIEEIRSSILKGLSEGKKFKVIKKELEAEGRNWKDIRIAYKRVRKQL